MPYTSSNANSTAPRSKNAALGNRSESPYQQRTAQRDNPTQQLIKQAVDFLIQQLEAGKSETLTTATVRETEAEAVAFIVGQAIGLEMGRASSDYIQMYAGNAALLAESLEVVQRTSAVILGAISAENAATEFSQETTEAAGPAPESKRARRSRQQTDAIAEVA